MKKWLGIYVCIALIGILLLSRIPSQKKQQSNIVVTLPTSKVRTHSKGLFLPYWGSEIDLAEMKYDDYYYFGVQPTMRGALENEVGLRNINITKNIPEKQKKLVLRMLNNTVTEALLEEKQAQKKLISQIITTLDSSSFSGIVLDIEVPFTLNAEKKDKITKFVQLICTAIKSDYKTCSVLVYGDTYYRSRPYDIKKLGGIADKILIMAYDFHKAGGEPGPNFPFDSGSTVSPSLRASPNYGYDFKQMISDFSTDVPKEKIEVVFGMYGYDWTLNAQGTPLKIAVALSVNHIKSKVESLNLKVTSNTAREKKIEYVDNIGKKHILWYEDEESSAVKTRYLQQQGIGQISFWAQSYF